MLKLLPLALLLVLPLTSCSSGADPGGLTEAGYDALGSGDHAAALAEFEAALAVIGNDSTHDQYLRAKLGAVEARIRVDATAARDEFLGLANDMAEEVTDQDFSFIGQKFAGAQEFSAAIDILDAGMKTHEGSTHLAQLTDNIRAAAERAGDQAALDKMAGLGYL